MDRKKSEVQAVKFQRFIYNNEKSRNWLDKNKFKTIGRVKTTPTELTYVIKDPKLFKRFFSTKPSRGISFIIGFKTIKPVKREKTKKLTTPKSQLNNIKSRIS